MFVFFPLFFFISFFDCFVFIISIMGNQSSSESSRVRPEDQVLVTEALENGLECPVKAPQTPTRASSAAFDPRSPSAPRSPLVPSSTTIVDPRSPLPSDRSPLAPVDQNSSRNAPKGKSRSKTRNVTVTTAAPIQLLEQQ